MKSSDVDVAGTSPARDSREALNWLAALVVTSLALLIVQLAAGFAAGALTLIADS